MNAHGLIQILPIASRFTGVIADSSMNRRQRVFLHQFQPGSLEIPGLCQSQPGLNVLACRTDGIAWGKPVQIKRTPFSIRPRPFGMLMQVGRKSAVTGMRLRHGAFDDEEIAKGPQGMMAGANPGAQPRLNPTILAGL